MAGSFNPPGTAQSVDVTFDPSDIVNVRVRNGNNTAYIEPATEGGNLASIKTNTDKIPSLGQAVKTGSVPVTLASDQGTLDTNLQKVNGTTISVNTGATGNGSPRVTVAVDTATVAGSASLPTGTNAIGKLAANDGVDIGDVTINNASGASAVNIQDGGNSITVDGTVTITPSGTQAVNQTQVNGVAVSVGSGASGTGTQRVSIATSDIVQVSRTTAANAAGNTIFVSPVVGGVAVAAASPLPISKNTTANSAANPIVVTVQNSNTVPIQYITSNVSFSDSNTPNPVVLVAGVLSTQIRLQNYSAVDSSRYINRTIGILGLTPGDVVTLYLYTFGVDGNTTDKNIVFESFFVEADGMAVFHIPAWPGLVAVLSTLGAAAANISEHY